MTTATAPSEATMPLLDSAAADQPATRQRSRLGQLAHQYGELTKFRLSGLVVFTSAVGYLAACTPGLINWFTLLCTVVGTALVAGAASAFNELWEIRRDARMHRTMNRPLPTGVMSPAHAYLLAMLMTLAGTSLVAIGANLGAAGLNLLALLLYVFIYTPLKPLTTLNTIVGAVVGALPPMAGWVAATGSLSTGAWMLGLLLFIWQLPHFFALAWMYREDYARGGFRMLPVVDPTGRLTCQVIFATTLLLLPLGFLFAASGVATPVFAMGATIGGLLMLAMALQMARRFNNFTARRLFIASIIYLPIMLAMLAIDAQLIAPQLPGSLAHQRQSLTMPGPTTPTDGNTNSEPTRVEAPPAPFIAQTTR